MANEYTFFQETDEDRYFIETQRVQEDAQRYDAPYYDILEENMSIVELKHALASRGVGTSLRELLIFRLKGARAAEYHRHGMMNSNMTYEAAHR